MSKQIITGIYEAFGRGDLPSVISALAEDVQWDVPGPAPFAGPRKGHEGVQQFFLELLGAVKIEMFEVDAVIGDGDLVVVVGRERCTVLRTGRGYEQHWAHAYTLRAGKVVSVRMYEDTQAQAAAFSPSA